jgi:hypothetical protein
VDPWVREEAEWTHLSFDSKGTELPRVLLVGDSICNGYGGRVRNLLAGSFAVDHLQTSEGTACPKFTRMLDYMMDRRKYRVVHLNVGIHLHGVSPDEYEENLARILLHVREKCGAEIVFATTTPAHSAGDVAMLDRETTDRYRVYNEKAAAVCARLNMGMDDLFAASMADGLPKVDRHHYTPAGYDRLGDAVAATIRQAVF